MRKTSKIILVTIIATSILLGLGYAAIQNITLNILGTASAQTSQDNFKVRFVGTPVVSDAVNVTASVNTDTTASINVTGLTERGQSVTATYEIENQSNDLSSDLTISTTNSNTEYFRISSRLAENSIVSGEKTTVTVTVEMLKTPIDESVSANVGVELTAMPVEPGKEGTSENINDFSQTPIVANEYGFYYEEAYTLNIDGDKLTYIFFEEGEGAIFYNDMLVQVVSTGGFKYDTLAVDIFGEDEYAKFSTDGRKLFMDSSETTVAYLDESFVDSYDAMSQYINEYGFYYGKMYSAKFEEDIVGSLVFYENNTVGVYTNGILESVITDVEYSENQAEYNEEITRFFYDGLVVNFGGAILCLDKTHFDTYEILEKDKNQYGFYYDYAYTRMDENDGLVSCMFHEDNTISVYLAGVLIQYIDEEVVYSNNTVSSDGIKFNMVCDGTQATISNETYLLDYEYARRINEVKAEKNEYGFYFGKHYSTVLDEGLLTFVFNEDGSISYYEAGEFVGTEAAGSAVYSLNTIVSTIDGSTLNVTKDGTMLEGAGLRFTLDLYFEDRDSLLEEN